MTNEEKAKEIANVFIDVAVGAGAFSGALEMAEWKDQQFKEYLEKEREDIHDLIIEYGKRGYVTSHYESELDLLNEIIYELFKED